MNTNYVDSRTPEEREKDAKLQELVTMTVTSSDEQLMIDMNTKEQDELKDNCESVHSLIQKGGLTPHQLFLFIKETRKQAYNQGYKDGQGDEVAGRF